MATYLVVGAGAIGTVVAQDLAQQGQSVRLLSRRGIGPEHELIERIAGDASDAATVTQHAKGADAIFNCANPAYHRWPTDWPPIANALLAAAEASGAGLVTLNNLYAYGQPSGPMTPNDPLSATYEKAQVRATMWHDAKQAHDERRVRATEVRASDFIGPRSGELSRTTHPAHHQREELSGHRQRRRTAQLELHRGRRAHVGDVCTGRPVLGPRVARPGESRALGASGHRRHRADRWRHERQDHEGADRDAARPRSLQY